jgi:hypothetical protein
VAQNENSSNPSLTTPVLSIKHRGLDAVIARQAQIAFWLAVAVPEIFVYGLQEFGATPVGPGTALKRGF